MTLAIINADLARHAAHTMEVDGGVVRVPAPEGGLCGLCYCAPWIVEALHWLVAQVEKEG